MTCIHCGAPVPEGSGDGRHLCPDCSRTLKAAVDPRVMVELTRYWERRLLEGREKDWT